MDTRKILTGLRAERDLLNRAIAALESFDSTAITAPRRGRPAAKAAPAARRGAVAVAASAPLAVSACRK